MKPLFFFNCNSCQSQEQTINLGGERIQKDSKKVHEHAKVCTKSIAVSVDIYKPYRMLL
jgi:hypothetical protein